MKLGSISKDSWVLSIFLHHCIFPSTHRATLTRLECVILCMSIHKEPFVLASSILEHMISICDTKVRKKEALPFGILITNMCLKAGVDLPPSSSTSIMSSMAPINHTSWNRSQGQSTQPLASKRKSTSSSASAPASIPVDIILARFATIEQKMFDHLDESQDLKMLISEHLATSSTPAG